MREVISSVGIDIGTSTTQLIFSKLTIENLASSYTVPRITIVDTEVIYRSKIYFTPLRDDTTIDAERVKSIVQEEYRKAGMIPKDLKTGAVIITGETARKENANQVLEALSEMAGDFVVATAGPDLESVLSAKGAGADKISKEDRNSIANIDIGGGTSNVAVFQKGNLISTSCVDIGGRLIKVTDGKITYIYSKTKELAKSIGIDINVGDRADVEKLSLVCKEMARQLAMSVNIIPKDDMHLGLYTNDGSPIDTGIRPSGLTFSGGVAEVIYGKGGEDVFAFGDIGVLLGRAICQEKAFKQIKVYESIEKIRATVVGAGTHTTEVSGSTIKYDKEFLPLKNIPVMKLTSEEEKDLEILSKRIQEKYEIFAGKGQEELVAIALSGLSYKSFDQVQDLAKAILKGLKAYKNPSQPILVILENDIGKVLGNALKFLTLEEKLGVICIDNIFVKDGDYVDIGEPVAGGRVLPVVTKTLIFNH